MNYFKLIKLVFINWLIVPPVFYFYIVGLFTLLGRSFPQPDTSIMVTAWVWALFFTLGLACAINKLVIKINGKILN